jgi:hypothetical protein
LFTGCFLFLLGWGDGEDMIGVPGFVWFVLSQSVFLQSP